MAYMKLVTQNRTPQQICEEEGVKYYRYYLGQHVDDNRLMKHYGMDKPKWSWKSGRRFRPKYHANFMRKHKD